MSGRRVLIVRGPDGGWWTENGPVCGQMFEAGYGGKGHPAPCTREPHGDNVHWTSTGWRREDAPEVGA